MSSSWKHRIHQSLWYEGLALLLVLPIVDYWMGHAGAALWLLVSLSIIVCCWTPIFNAGFDRYFEAPSSDCKRHWKVRMIHAVCFELSVVSITTPLVAWWSSLPLIDAVMLNLQIAALYMVYAYVFFISWDAIALRIERRKSSAH